jgi:hypothetical protein
MGCGASRSRRLKKDDVVRSRADRTRTGEIEDVDGTASSCIVRWDDTGDLSGELRSKDVEDLPNGDMQQRDAKYGSIVAQRKEQRRRQPHIVAGEKLVASSRTRLANGDIEAAKADRAKAALEYDQAKEDCASVLAVRMYIVDVTILVILTRPYR